jgi:coenzyme F420-dependent glucose-6-phosphate dehydrogenase
VAYGARVTLTLGYKASNEQFAPAELLDLVKHAEARGFEVSGVSDHFQPWRHNGGHAPGVLPWLGAAAASTSTISLGTSVLTPTMRYHPAIIAQAFATLGCLAPGRVFLGVGTGEAMNETPITGGEFPGRKERRQKLAEAIKVIRTLWEEDRVDFEGDFFTLRRATVYDKPDQPVPIYVAASGPLAAKLAGRVGDGFICTSGKDPQLYVDLLDNVREGAEQAGRDYEAINRMIEIKVSYDRDPDTAEQATHWWAALALTPEEKEGVEDPVEMERLADAAVDRAHTRFIVSADPQEIADRIQPYVDLGFTELVFHFPGNDQRRYLDEFAADVFPLLREANPSAATVGDARGAGNGGGGAAGA